MIIRVNLKVDGAIVINVHFRESLFLIYYILNNYTHLLYARLWKLIG